MNAAVHESGTGTEHESRRCSDSVSNVRVQQTKNGRRSNVARDPLQSSLSAAVAMQKIVSRLRVRTDSVMPS
jgi:hypothetical protein